MIVDDNFNLSLIGAATLREVITPTVTQELTTEFPMYVNLLQ